VTTEQQRRIVDAAYWRAANASERAGLAVAKSVAASPIVDDVRTIKADGTADEPVERGVWFTVSTEARDRDRDRIACDGWELRHFANNPVVPWAHNYSILPIGRARLVVVDRRTRSLRMLKEFASADMNPLAEQVFRLVKGGFLKTCSVGFIPLEYDDDSPQPGEDPSRRVGYFIQRQELLESSVVPIPSNPEALLEARSVAGVDLAPIGEWASRLLDEQPETGLWIPRKDLETAARIAGPQRTTFVLDGAKRALAPSVCSIVTIGAESEAKSAEPVASVVTIRCNGAISTGSDAARAIAAAVSTKTPEPAETVTTIDADFEIETEEIDAKATAYRPPKPVGTSAAHGLALAERCKASVSSGAKATAQRLAALKPCTEATVYRLASWFDAHAEDRKSADWANESAPTGPYLAWLHRGGDAGRDWSKALKKRLDEAEERSMTITTTTAAEPRSESSPSVVVSAAPSEAAMDAQPKATKADEPAPPPPPPAEGDKPAAEDKPKKDGAGGGDFDKVLELINQAGDLAWDVDVASIGPKQRAKAKAAVNVLELALEALGIDDEDAQGAAEEVEEPEDEEQPAEGQAPGEATVLAAPATTTKNPSSSESSAAVTEEQLRAAVREALAGLRGAAN
jgi:HK97 family phage prohead protease